ncbi:WD40 repeat-like protein [Trichodelitschia bisporula]|uniref:WD40 repeat-like protein n=1 Tax=Trichodelitschia bisporula TaxID=703511 RepID=A0A6G1HRZ6_9PEZI|nr:WD40 repeat-like protein [Trichodelitschia bisporula]
MADENRREPAMEPPSSPPQSTKPKRPPPITPKRFSKFFTPRNTSGGSRVTKRNVSQSRDFQRQLRTISGNSASIPRQADADPLTPHKTVAFANLATPSTVRTTLDMSAIPHVAAPGNKRKAPFSPPPSSSPMRSSPCKRFRQDSFCFESSPPPIPEELEEDVDMPVNRARMPTYSIYHDPIERVTAGGIAGRILQRSFGGLECLGRGRRKDICIDWQPLTANFYTVKAQSHTMGPVPFSVAARNTSAMVAVAAQDGEIRMLETDEQYDPPFTSMAYRIWPHDNAIMDMTFSQDDSILLTASGDQETRVIDVTTCQTKHIFKSHETSVKQVRFQPENESVIATSSRDGNVHIWDLRCAPLRANVAESEPSVNRRNVRVDHEVSHHRPINTIASAHSHARRMSRQQGYDEERSAYPSRAGDVSVTSLTFLTGNTNLIVTASEAETSVKVWDIRSRYNSKGATPLATVEEPQAHKNYRSFGVTSMVLNGSGSRLYALARDNTVYAYSTNHLILGHAPELNTVSTRRRHGNTDRKGLAPLYGFRHPQFYATSFYVKLALRPASNDRAELLAAGSSGHCPVLFPTDEGLFHDDYEAERWQPEEHFVAGGRPHMGHMDSGFPIYKWGMALPGGHSNEVSGVAWTAHGELVSIGDDRTARLWREDQGVARDMRARARLGESSIGDACADVPEDWDEDDG